jgi:hypothetical protein
MRSDHDIDYRGVYFERLDRIREIMRGNPDYNEPEARGEARKYARKLTGGSSPLHDRSDSSKE